MSNIGVSITYEGTEQGAAQIGRLQQNLTAASTAQAQASRTAQDVGRSATAMGGAMGGAAQQAGTAAQRFGQVQGLMGPMVGSLGRMIPAFSSLSGAIGQVSTGMLSMSAGMGPAGLAIAGITIVLSAVSAAMDDTQSEAAQLAEAFETELRSVRRLESGLRDLAQAQSARRTAAIERFQEGDVDREARARAEIHAAETMIETTRRLRSEDMLTAAQAEERIARLQRSADDARAELAFANRLGGSAAERAEQEERQQRELQGEIGAARNSASGGRRERTQTFAQQEAAAWREASAARQLYDDILAEGLAQEQALALQNTSIDQQLHENRLERQRIETDAMAAHYAQIREREQEALDKAKEANRERMRSNQSLGQEAGSIAKTIGSAYFDAFQVAIEGTMSLEDALLAATKQILKSIGEELVARGIGKILEGIAEIPSPTAATKIGGGVAMVGFGIGLGAAGAAIPSPNAGGAESPREQPDDSDSGPRGDTTIIFGNPVLTAGTQAQLARGLSRVAKGGHSFPATVGR